MKKLVLLILLSTSFLTFSQSQILDTSIKTLNGETTSLSEISSKNDLVIVARWIEGSEIDVFLKKVYEAMSS